MSREQFRVLDPPVTCASCWLPDGLLPHDVPHQPHEVVIRATACGWNHAPSAPTPIPLCDVVGDEIWQNLLIELMLVGASLPRLPWIDLAGRFALAGLIFLVCFRMATAIYVPSWFLMLLFTVLFTTQVSNGPRLDAND
jgi:hypothetical protein